MHKADRRNLTEVNFKNVKLEKLTNLENILRKILAFTEEKHMFKQNCQTFIYCHV